MSEKTDIVVKLLTTNGAMAGKSAVAPISIMDIKRLIKKHELNQRLVAKLSGITYDRFRNCMNKDNYEFKKNELEAIKNAILGYVSDIINDISGTEKKNNTKKS